MLLGCAAQATYHTFQSFHQAGLSSWSPVWISVACGSNMLFQCVRTSNKQHCGLPHRLQSQLQLHQQWALSIFFSSSEHPALGGSLLPAHTQNRSEQQNHTFLIGAMCFLPQAILPLSRWALGSSRYASVPYHKPSPGSWLQKQRQGQNIKSWTKQRSDESRFWKIRTWHGLSSTACVTEVGVSAQFKNAGWILHLVRLLLSNIQGIVGRFLLNLK